MNEHEKVKLAETCVTNIGERMDANRLKMNSDKTEILFGSHQQVAKVETSASMYVIKHLMNHSV